MNGTPPLPPSAQPKTCGLAIWSLVLGILSLACLYILAAIPAVICGHVAHSRVKRSGGALTGEGLALAGLVTGYVGIALSLVVLPLLLAIAVPNFVKARQVAQERQIAQGNACNNNLRQLDGAKQQWALENKKQETDMPTTEQLKALLYRHEFPVCPAGGMYRINPVNKDPTCSIPDHCLPAP